MIHTENLTKSYKSGLMSRSFVPSFNLLLLDINLGEGLMRSGTKLLWELRQWAACRRIGRGADRLRDARRPGAFYGGGFRRTPSHAIS